MCKKISFLFLLFLFTMGLFAQRIKGHVYDETGVPLSSATVVIEGTQYSTLTDDEGEFKFKLGRLPQGQIMVHVSFIGYKPQTKEIVITENSKQYLRFNMEVDNTLAEVEVFGERFKQPEKLDVITRMPLRPSEQIQSISVISDKVITEQGALTITDAIRNVPGVTLFGSYGGARESMSTRGYRGVPILKNGVRIDSDFRTASLTSDMQGVESIQVIKGSAAVTQGVGNDLGSPGGVINVVTKTPKFITGGDVALRVGSWGQVRPTFDVQSVLDKNRTVAVRLNGAFERADSYRTKVSKERVYINPSLEWRPDSKTVITLEMDYLSDNTTPDPGTINLDGDSIEALYKMPHDKFLGFDSDNIDTKIATYAARATREIADGLSLRVAYFASSNNVDNTGASISTKRTAGQDNIRQRSLNRSLRDDKNSTFQLDLVGRDLYTGSIKHTFQLGFDYKTNNVTTNNYGYYALNSKTGKREFTTGIPIDVINVFEPINNTLVMPTAESLGISNDSLWVLGKPVESESSNYGFMAQEVMTINQYVKAILGIRYSYGTSSSNTSTGKTTGNAWNPMFGLMVSPLKNVNLFGSYTTTTSLRSATNKMSNGEEIGASPTKQWEFGVKSDWLNDRLRFNFTYFHIMNKNLSNTEYVEGTNQKTGYYIKAGNLKRSGVEVELSGRVLENLQVMLGYAYLDAKYEDSPSYVNGSAPMNAPKHTANGWVYYTVNKSTLKGLSVGVGTYYVGKRPVNEYSLTPNGHGSPVGVKPFDMPAYTTVNAQVAYSIGNVTARVFFNNIFDEIGYNSYYRGGYINQIDPRNFSGVVSYRF